MNHKLNINSVVGDLILTNTSVEISDIFTNVYHIFEMDKSIPGILLLRDGQLCGLLSKNKFLELMSRPFMYSLYSKRTIDTYLRNNTSGKYLVLSSGTSIIKATLKAIQRIDSDIFEPVIVDCDNNELAVLDFYQLLVAQNKIQSEMNELLNKANEFKKEVLEITTHDLRNPISLILGFSNLITCNNDIEKCKEFAGNIHKTAIQMDDLVTSFLTSTINDSIEYKFEFSKFEIGEFMNSVVRSFKYSAEKKMQKINFENINIPYYITSDKLKIKEVVDNLLSNAIKYSGHGLEINVLLQQSGNNIEISIKDNGPGFTESDFKKVFRKFQRLSAQPTANESSTGLGLYIAKTIVEKLGGTIDLKSQPGKGALFTVIIPVNFPVPILVE